MLPDRPDIPEEATGPAAEKLCESIPADLELRGGTWIEDPLADEWGEWVLPALQAAAPALRNQGAEEAEARFRGALAKLWERAEAEKDKAATAFDERDKMAGDEGASTEAYLLDDFHRCLEELFPRCGGEGVLDVERGSEAGAVFDTEPCPGCPDCLFADHDTTAIDQALAKGAEEERERLREAFRDKDVLFDRDRLQRAVFAALDTAVPSED